jgi:rhomboid protease GluP
MPKHQDNVVLSGKSNKEILSIAYEAFLKLGWLVEFASVNKLFGNTPKKWNSKTEQMIIEIEDGVVHVSSEMVNGEILDITGINKKNVTAFIKTIGEVNQIISTEEIQSNQQTINNLIEQTNHKIKEQEKEDTALDVAMNLSGSNLYATYAIIAINILVFIFMALDGAGIIDLNPYVHIKWGSNVTQLTLSGEWWRLLTSTFIHFGIIHVGMNMYCLYSIGIYLEPMLGKVKYVIAYLCTGILASIVSLWWHKEGLNGAGASGAVFGMYGLFLAFLTTNIIPKQVREALLKSIGLFVVYNLAYGMKSGVDNAAHIGGLVSGFAIGFLYVLGIKKEKNGIQLKWMLPLVVMLTLGVAVFYLQQNKMPVSSAKAIKEEIKDATYKDNEKYNTSYNEFVACQTNAINILNDTALQVADKKNKINNTAMEEWQKATTIVQTMKNMDVSKEKKEKLDHIMNYINLRKEEALLHVKVLENDPLAEQKLNEIIKQIDDLVSTIQ